MTYGWDAVPNRTSVTTGGTPVTTTYDAAHRPTSTGYASDDDGRLTARPTSGGQSFVWDDLGRLTQVKNAAGTVTLATYTYDPLDRLRLVDRGSTDQVRFRYVGLTTAVAQILDHDAGTVSRNIATSWDGTRLADWTGAGSDLRIYGTNAHHDVTFTTGAAGTVTATARYDPWGTLASSTGTLSDFGFQGSWTDATTELAWVITRWYAPAEGRFISEDSLLGDPARPASRHLYAYGEGEPVGRWDPDGRSYRYAWRKQWSTDIPAKFGFFVGKTAACVGVGLVASYFATPMAGSASKFACDTVMDSWEKAIFEDPRYTFHIEDQEFWISSVARSIRVVGTKITVLGNQPGSPWIKRTPWFDMYWHYPNAAAWSLCLQSSNSCNGLANVQVRRTWNNGWGPWSIRYRCFWAGHLGSTPCNPTWRGRP